MSTTGCRRSVLMCGLAAITATLSCTTGVVVTDDQLTAVSQVFISNIPRSLGLGDSAQLRAVALDAVGTPLAGREVQWDTPTPTVIAVRAGGMVVGLQAGTGVVRARSEGISATADVAVLPAGSPPLPPDPVTAVTIQPTSPSTVVGDSVLLVATLYDAAGQVLTGRTVTWTTTTPSVVAVRPTGQVVGLAAGAASVHATSEGVTGKVVVTVIAPTTNPPPGPGPGEPVFTTGVSQELFADDFEVYRDRTDLVTWQSHYPGRYAVRNPDRIELRTTGAFAGQKSARFHWPVSETYHDADVLLEVANISGSAVPVVVYQFMVKFKAGFPFKRRAEDRNGAGHKLFIHNLKGEGWERVVVGGGSVLPQFFPEYEAGWPERIAVNFSIGDLYYQTNLNGKLIDGDGYLNDGQWHRFTVRMTGSTFRTRTTGNGRIEAWVDGTKIIEYLGDVAGRPEYGKVAVARTVDGLFDSLQFPTVFNGGPGPAQGDQWVEFDNWRAWRP